MHIRPNALFWAVVCLIVTIAVVNGFALEMRLYWMLRWFDIVMHFAGGLWTGLFGIWLARYSNFFPGRIRALRPLTVALVSAFTIGVLWEGFEQVANVTYGSFAEQLQDTLLDIVMDMLGGVAAWGISLLVREDVDVQVHTK